MNLKSFLSSIVSGLLLFYILVCPESALAARVSANLDRAEAQVQDEIHLSIRVEDVQGNVQAPRVPGIDGCDIFYTGRSSHLAFINGQQSSSVEFNYVLVPRKAGIFTIQPIEIQAGGQNFATEPIKLQVTEGQKNSNSQSAATSGWNAPQIPPDPFAAMSNSRQQRQQTPAPSQNSPTEVAPTFRPEDDNIYIVAKTNKTVAYPNEQILLSYSLYTRYDTRYEGFQDEPEVSGFWIEEFPMDQNVPKETVVVNGKRYIKADVKKYALFPTAPADYTIKPGTLKASIRREAQRNSVFDDFFDDSFFSGGNFFARREDLLLKPPPIQIQIKPFPENGKPINFQGAVGNFRLSATIDKAFVKQDEPATLNLVIEGEGNIETLNKPQIPEVDGFRTYDADAKHQLFRTGDQIGGRKTFEIVFIPTKSGQLKIPAIEFSYFNPQSQSYKTIRTQEFVLNVAKSDQPTSLLPQLAQSENLKKDIEVEKRDILSIHEAINPQGIASNVAFLNYIFGLLNTVLTIFLVFIFFSQYRNEALDRNVALKRRSKARAQAEKNLGKLNHQLKKGKISSDVHYFDEIARIMTQYLTDKLNLSTLGVTKQDLEQKLAELLGVEDPLYREIVDFYAWCDMSRFAKADVSTDAKNNAQRILKDAMNRLEKVK